MTKVRNAELYQEALDRFNQPVLLGDRLARLVGYGEDNMDCYFICISNVKGLEKIWNTCVGGYIFLDRLRGQNEVVSSHNGDIWDDYFRMETWLPPPYEKFELSIESELTTHLIFDDK